MVWRFECLRSASGPRSSRPSSARIAQRPLASMMSLERALPLSGNDAPHRWPTTALGEPFAVPRIPRNSTAPVPNVGPTTLRTATFPFVEGASGTCPSPAGTAASALRSIGQARQIDREKRVARSWSSRYQIGCFHAKSSRAWFRRQDRSLASAPSVRSSAYRMARRRPGAPPGWSCRSSAQRVALTAPRRAGSRRPDRRGGGCGLLSDTRSGGRSMGTGVCCPTS